MASSSEASSLKTSRKLRGNLETYCLIWLDPTVNSKENTNAQQKLRSVINNLQVFEDINQCEEFIRSVSSQDRLVLIISGDFGQQLIPDIHQFQQVYSIYIYCINNEFCQQWSEQYTKIKGIHNQVDQLIAQVHGDHMRRMQHTIDEPLSMSIYNTNVSSEQTTSGLDGRFVHSQLLIDCLLRMQPTPTDKNEFISLCLKEYDGNETQLKTIHEFEEEYSSEKSIEWYTRDTFLYRSLNKSLRVQDIGLLFGFRFLIRDIEQQLQKYRCTSLTRLYRGQLISTEELEVLQESKGKLISMNSFFSTSLDRNIALMFLDPSNNDNKLKKVLFEIDADPCRDHVKPFANITSFSYYQEEKEVLMMLGSVFRIDNIHLDQHHIWVVNLTLCSDTDHDLKSVFDHMKNQYGAEQTRLLLFGHVLVDMAHFDDAEDYYHRLLKELPPDHTDLSNCYHALGKVACEKADYDLSLEWLYKSLHILQRKLKTDDPRMGFIHTTIGEVCQRKGDYKQALESYETALQIWTKVHHDQHDSIAWCYNNLGIVYDEQKEYSKALDFHKKSLKIKTKILPPQHPCLGNAYLNIGNVYYHLGEYNQALEYYQLSCNIYRQSLTPEHPSIASAVKNIGIIYEAQNEYSKALQNYRKASIIREKTFSSSHPDSLQIEKDIERVLLKMK